MKLALEKSVPAAFAAMLLILLLVCSIAYRSIADLTDDALSVQRAHRVQIYLSELRAAVAAAEIAQGRYTITGNDNFLEPFRVAEPLIARQVTALRALISDASQERHLDALVPVVARRIAIGNEIIELRRTQGFDAARARIATGETQRLQERLREIVAAMIAAHQTILTRAEEHTRMIARQTLAILMAGALLAIVAVGAAIYIVQSSFKSRAAAERDLQASNSALAASKDRAEAADRIKSAFLATMSHELRTPLNSIIGFTGVLLQELPGPLNAEQSKQLTMVRASGHHLLALINDVLDISKIEAGELQMYPAAFDLRDSIGKVSGIVQPLADKKGLAFTATVAPELSVVVNDVRRVEQVLLNLLNNAIKFTERGSVTLAARPVADAGGRHIEIAVSDTGTGIRREDLGVLFQPFRQIDSALSRNHEGTGLGLAICQRLIKLMGGSIHVTSEWQRGSVFSILLPAAEQTP